MNANGHINMQKVNANSFALALIDRLLIDMCIYFEWNFVYFLIAHQNKLNFVKKRYTHFFKTKKSVYFNIVFYGIQKNIVF